MFIGSGLCTRNSAETVASASEIAECHRMYDALIMTSLTAVEPIFSQLEYSREDHVSNSIE